MRIVFKLTGIYYCRRSGIWIQTICSLSSINLYPN